MPSIAVSTCLLASAMLVLAPTPALAEGELVEGGDVVDIGGGGATGMSASNPRVKSLLAAHPGAFVTICVAGCAGKPSIVQMLPKPMQARRGEMRTTAGTMDGPQGRRPAYPVGFGAVDVNAVTCVAGCVGAPGQIIQNLPGLPPPPPKVAPQKDADANAIGNEPLDVGR